MISLPGKDELNAEQRSRAAALYTVRTCLGHEDTPDADDLIMLAAWVLDGRLPVDRIETISEPTDLGIRSRTVRHMHGDPQ